ncbi:MAG: MASE1 domain-containing protein [Candidatus Eisenbacteria bacterium]|nr:MASE1 domain-containing protein [Candidatus Eisenbacteria bacterium]
MSFRRPAGVAAEILALAGLYYLGARLGLLYATLGGNATPLWPSAGLALAAMILRGPRAIPGIFLGSFLSSLEIPHAFSGSAVIALGNTLEPLAGWWILRRLARLDPSLCRVRDVLWLVLPVALLSPLLSAGAGCVVLREGGRHAWAQVEPAARVWWLGDVMGMLAVAPFLITWLTPPRPRFQAGRFFEGLAVLTLCAGVTALVFRGMFHSAYLLFPFVIWMALRFGPRGASLTALLLTAIAAWETVSGRGPFFQGSVRESLLELDTFAAVMISTALLLAAAVTERRRHADALRGSETRFRTLVESMHDVVATLDLEGRHTALFGVPEGSSRFARDQFLGRTAVEVLGPKAGAVHEQANRRALRGENVVYDWEFTLEGPVRQFQTALSPLHGPAGEVAGLVSVTREMTDLRSLEAQLRHAVKMEAVGRLAGGVAHDFNNLLTTILGHADLLRERLPADSPMRADAEQIRRSGERAAALTWQLLAFSRKQVVVPRVLDLNTIVAELEKMLGRVIGEHIVLVTRLDPAPALVRADRGQIEQVILNLVVNARDAMPEGGRLEIETRRVELHRSEARGPAAVAPGPYVSLRVTDDGAGMDPEVQRHIFEPFYTTKAHGQGTGLGLAMVYGIAEQAGGCIQVRSRPGEGSSFDLCLPRVTDATGADPPPAPPAAPPGRGVETILLVEDEEAVRQLLRRVLEKAGYRVIEAACAEDAMEIARAHAQTIHLLLSDVVMPGMSGTRLAEHMLAERPGLRVLFMTGYTDEGLTGGGTLIRERGLLQKPIRPDDLLRHVRSTLDSR